MSRTAALWMAVAVVALAAAGCGGGTTPPQDGGQCVSTGCAGVGGRCGTVADNCGNLINCPCPDAGPRDGGAADGGGTDGGPSQAGKIGSACETDDECIGADAFCIYGFCTRQCGQGGSVSDCNNPQLSNPSGPFGGVYSCWGLGEGLISICWPNGTGEACSAGGTCTKSGEVCIGGKCQVPSTPGGTTRRSDFRCHRDGDCASGEGCAILGNLDDDNIRSEGACLSLGTGPDARKPGGSPCGATADPDRECGSFFCNQTAGTCVGLCLQDSDCPSGNKCTVIGLLSSGLDEFAAQGLGICTEWTGSRLDCTANANCPSGEFCDIYQKLVNNDTALALAGACAALPRTNAGAVGAPCSTDAQCNSNNCITNPLTGLGYCGALCLGGDADCGGGTSCRSVIINAQDPATAADDLRTGFCVQTTPLSLCFVDTGCKVCSSDADCNASQGVTCVKSPPSAPTGICRDLFGRCADPCRHDCTPGGPNNGGCPTGSTCTTTRLSQTQDARWCRDNASGECVRADLAQVLVYEHGMCGDAEFLPDGGVQRPQQDLCYYYGRPQVGGRPTDIFVCGQSCTPDGGAACPTVPIAGDAGVATVCRTVHEFGVNVPGTGAIGGAAFPTTQCAPADAFAPIAADGGAGGADGGAGGADGGS